MVLAIPRSSCLHPGTEGAVQYGRLFIIVVGCGLDRRRVAIVDVNVVGGSEIEWFILEIRLEKRQRTAASSPARKLKPSLTRLRGGPKQTTARL
jgi:hypothetical protein